MEFIGWLKINSGGTLPPYLVSVRHHVMCILNKKCFCNACECQKGTNWKANMHNCLVISQWQHPIYTQPLIFSNKLQAWLQIQPLSNKTEIIFSSIYQDRSLIKTPSVYTEFWHPRTLKPTVFLETGSIIPILGETGERCSTSGFLTQYRPSIHHLDVPAQIWSISCMSCWHTSVQWMTNWLELWHKHTISCARNSARLFSGVDPDNLGSKKTENRESLEMSNILLSS